MKRKSHRFNARIKFAIQALKSSLVKTRGPLIVSLAITNRCNLECAYCYYSYQKKADKDLSLETIKRFLDESYAMGTRFIILSGGEPLLRKNVKDIIQLVNDKGMLASLVTNGFFLADRAAELQDVSHLCISLDGEEKIHDSIRGKGSFKRIMKGIEEAKKYNIPIRINATLTKRNKESVDFLMDFTLKKRILFGVCFLYKSVDDSKSDLVLSDDEIRDILRRIIDYKKKGYPFLFSLKNLEYALNWPFSYKKIQLFDGEVPSDLRKIKCYWGRRMCVLEGNGKVFPCIALNNRFDALNFMEVGFKKAWEHACLHTCQTCYHLPNNEYNGFFGLDPRTWLNLIKVSIKDLRNAKKIDY